MRGRWGRVAIVGGRSGFGAVIRALWRKEAGWWLDVIWKVRDSLEGVDEEHGVDLKWWHCGSDGACGKREGFVHW